MKSISYFRIIMIIQFLSFHVDMFFIFYIAFFLYENLNFNSYKMLPFTTLFQQLYYV